MSAAGPAWWPVRKAWRLFFDDWHLSVPTMAWLALSLLFRRLGLAPAWHGLTLFGGFAVILIGATAAKASLPPRRGTGQRQVRHPTSTAKPVDCTVKPGS